MTTKNTKPTPTDVIGLPYEAIPLLPMSMRVWVVLIGRDRPTDLKTLASLCMAESPRDRGFSEALTRLKKAGKIDRKNGKVWFVYESLPRAGEGGEAEEAWWRATKHDGLKRGILPCSTRERVAKRDAYRLSKVTYRIPQNVLEWLWAYGAFDGDCGYWYTNLPKAIPAYQLQSTMENLGVDKEKAREAIIVTAAKSLFSVWRNGGSVESSLPGWVIRTVENGMHAEPDADCIKKLDKSSAPAASYWLQQWAEDPSTAPTISVVRDRREAEISKKRGEILRVVGE